MPESLRFNPYDFDTHQSLPAEQKSNFAPVTEGGFVKSTAKDAEKKFKQQAKKQNRGRSLIDKLLGRKKVKPLDLAHQAADEEEYGKEWDRMIAQRNQERIDDSWRQYHENVSAVENGTFPVKVGSLVFRVVGGIKMGGNWVPGVGDQVAQVYATPHPEAIEAILRYNDTHQSYYDRMPFDANQQVAIIKVADFSIPEPDITHDPATDHDQVLVQGEVVEILRPQDFFKRY